METPPPPPLKAAMLHGVDLALWGEIVDEKKLGAAAAALEAAGDAPRLAPPPALVFEFLRYGGPQTLKAVIIGQDPYPQPGAAQGLCFSVPRGRPVPASLQRVFGCLERAGLRAPRPPGAQACGDLRPWAVQGVLLLNAALTTREGACNAHSAEWKPFVREFIRRLCAAREGREPLHFLLWGAAAREHAAVARRHGHVVHEWSHPSPTRDNSLPPPARFRECPHFEEVNAVLAARRARPIVWDNQAAATAFSDGACLRNGQPDARAAYAAVLVGGAAPATLRGQVLPQEYELRDEAAPERGFQPTGRPAEPSNNRAELLGVAHALLGLLATRALGSVELWTDSRLCVDTLCTWLPARLEKKTERELKNFDLVWVAWRLLGALRAQAAEVKIEHVRSHQPAPRAPDPAAPEAQRELLAWRGNRLADRHASEALAGGAGPLVLRGPPVLDGLYARLAA